MRYQLTFWICLILIGAFCFSVSAQEATQPAKPATQEAPAKKKKEFEDFSKLLRTVKATRDFSNYIRKKRTSIAKFSPPNWTKPFLCMISVARGLGQGFLLSGMTLEEWMLVWRRVGDKVHLVRKNTRFRATRREPRLRQAVDLGHKRLRAVLSQD